MSIPVGTTARSKYRFEAEHKTELSLEAGELVTVLEPSREGWTYCSRFNKASEKGCCPTNYLEATANSHQKPQAQQQQASGIVNSSRSVTGGGGGAGTTSGPNSGNQSPVVNNAATNSGRGTPSSQQNRNNNNNTNTSLISNPNSTAAASTNRASPIPQQQQHRRNHSQSSAANQLINITPDQTALMEGFQKNELYFQQLLAQRQEANANLDSSLREAASEIDQAKERHNAMERRLKELDNTITKERKRWKDRVEEERMLLAQRTGNAAPNSNNNNNNNQQVANNDQQQFGQRSTLTSTTRGGAPPVSRYGRN